MTWSMFAINYLDLNVSSKADYHFENSFRKYLQPPFLIWREVAAMGTAETIKSDRKMKPCATDEEEAGAVNFLTGAGGFLQSILYGYCGVRVLSDRLEINEPRLLPSTNELIITGIKYHGLSIDLIVRARNHPAGNSLRFYKCKEQVIEFALDGKTLEAECTHFEMNGWRKYDFYLILFDTETISLLKGSLK